MTAETPWAVRFDTLITPVYNCVGEGYGFGHVSRGSAMKFAVCFMIVVTTAAGWVGAKIVDSVEAAESFRPNVEQVITEIRHAE